MPCQISRSPPSLTHVRSMSEKNPGVEWCGVGWGGVEWGGVMCSGVEWSGVEWSGEVVIIGEGVMIIVWRC